ncbi:hypothetical protein [Streptomyces gardneri]|uniref:hypothetical protein n=1 Tax=Streptomyces gardneri TaxID=66892 RepID=UPI0036D1DC58
MATIALDALQDDPLRGGRRTLHDLLRSLSDGPVAADACIEGTLGIALLIHRRDDGLVSEELYYSIRDEAEEWATPEHLGGAILGLDLAMPAASQHAPASSGLAVVSSSEALIYTGRRDLEDGFETVQACTVLARDDVDALEITDLSHDSAVQGGRRMRNVRSPLIEIVVLPGTHLRVSALRRKGEALTATGDFVDFPFPEQ